MHVCYVARLNIALCKRLFPLEAESILVGQLRAATALPDGRALVCSLGDGWRGPYASVTTALDRFKPSLIEVAPYSELNRVPSKLAVDGHSQHRPPTGS